ncbi:hypothetical protein ACJMK2_004071 [Sinanodonta woodiana]|uniref:Uncharacterized protein n=1 Tax=Sinanodonta woodiana TaxID=1069815 RepID=A0ABD3Y206_SINWO
MKASEIEMELINIPYLPFHAQDDVYETLEMFYNLSAALGGRVYGPPNNLPSTIFVLKELTLMDPSEVTLDYKNLFDAMKEAAFALSDKNTAVLGRKEEDLLPLFTNEEKKEWPEYRLRILELLGMHKETVRKIHHIERMCIASYVNSRIAPPNADETLTCSGTKIYTTRCTLHRSEKQIREKLVETAARLRESIIFSTESKIQKILMTLRNLTNAVEKHIIKVDPAVLSRRLQEVTSWTYKTPRVKTEDFLSLMSPRLVKDLYSAFSKKTEMNSGTSDSTPITYENINIYVKSSECLYLQNGSGNSCLRARKIKQKLVSKDAKRAFGWTRSTPLSQQRWVLYSISNIKKIY